MEHFDEGIQGWNTGIPPLYKQIVELSKDGAHFVEVGAWKGKSAAYMAVEIVNSGKNIKFDCVDTWEGDLNEQSHLADEHFQTHTLFEHFTQNMKPVEHVYTAVRLPSLEAAKLYADQSLDFVFIDAAHDYVNVLADIAAWLPKVKKGGILAGHDFHHPPVIQAVNESIVGVKSLGVCWYTFA
jgi:predicted O-methyltransferase YrrM